MAEIIRKASAGTLESSDAYVEIEPGSGIDLDLESVVITQYGDQIRATVKEVLDQFGIKDAKVKITDRGALDCVIRARLETAIARGEE
ncbi:MAG: citrate lyase acyl carrier protein [Eubacterium sp.]|jgi:citrate lyase subunit gamma (acyl carrier protein)